MALERLLNAARRLRALYRDLRWAGDYATLRLLRHRPPGMHTATVRCLGRTHTIHVRGQTLDIDLARLILCDDSEYRPPAGLDPRVIVDAGANIGMTTLYLATRFPRAHVYAFEPLPDNVELLERNTAAIAGRVTIIPKGLSDHEGLLDYHPSNDPANLGGGTFTTMGCDTTRSLKLPVTTLARFCAEKRIDRIDLLKLDVEGAEAEVLRGTPSGVLSRCRAIIGELRGSADLAVLRQLSATHTLGYNKPLDHACYPFVATLKPPHALAA